MPRPESSLVGPSGKDLAGLRLGDHTDGDRIHQARRTLGTEIELHMARRCSKTLLDRTLREWQGYYAIPLTEQDANDITKNLLEFFDVLMEWDNHRDFTNN